MTRCARCGRPFNPMGTAFKGRKMRCCTNCQARNLFDALDMPTPPELLDPYTKNPTLTDREFRKKLDDIP